MLSSTKTTLIAGNLKILYLLNMSSDIHMAMGNSKGIVAMIKKRDDRRSEVSRKEILVQRLGKAFMVSRSNHRTKCRLK